MAERLPQLWYLERYRNEGTRTYSKHAAYSEADAQYRPDGDQAQFDLPVFAMPAEQMKCYHANPSPQLAARYLGEAGVLLPVHPQILAQCGEDPYVERVLALGQRRPPIQVMPTSSTRTVAVVEAQSPGHALKVHFPFQVSRYTRKMRAEVIEQAVNVSRELEAGIGCTGSDFAFLREVIGVAHLDLNPQSKRGENWGYLVREMTPYPLPAGETALVPGFALYGQDYYDGRKPPLLFDLVGDREPLACVLEQIMLPIVRHWATCFSQFGFIIEPHGQNVLLEVGGGGDIERIVHRDLSVGIDMRRRRDLGLDSEGLNSYNRTEDSAFNSITYDRFMGGHFFERIVTEMLAHYPGLQRGDFTSPCREAFARLLPDYAAYFPQTVWYFSEKRDRYNKPLHEDTGEKPEWRP